MMRKRRCVYVFFMLTLLFVGACGKRPTEIDHIDTAEELNQAFIDVSKAVEIVLSPDEGAQDVLLSETFAGKRGETDVDTYWSMGDCKRNEESGFYTVEHGKDMAQYGDLYQIFRVDLKTNEREMLYETRDAAELNEFEVTGSFLFWKESVPQKEKEDWTYRVMQYELATGEVRCIAERENIGAELNVSEQYVVWYEPSGEGWLEIVSYDIQKQEFHTLPGIKDFAQGTPGFRPFSSLKIIDGGITYFSEAEGGNTYINRYDLNTRTTDAQLLVKGRGTKLVGCFSSKRYIGWELDDGSAWDSKYYFYDRSIGALYCICGDKDKRVNVFSEWFSDYLYFNCTYGGVDNTLFVFDPASGKVWQQKLEGIGMQFSKYGSGQVCLEVRTDEEAKLMTIQIPQ